MQAYHEKFPTSAFWDQTKKVHFIFQLKLKRSQTMGQCYVPQVPRQMKSQTVTSVRCRKTSQTCFWPNTLLFGYLPIFITNIRVFFVFCIKVNWLCLKGSLYKAQHWCLKCKIHFSSKWTILIKNHYVLYVIETVVLIWFWRGFTKLLGTLRSGIKRKGIKEWAKKYN